jgi:hypothetical protein
MKKRSFHHVVISFSGDTLTHFGGIYLLQSFFKQLKLRRQLHRYLQFPQRNNRFTVAEEMLALIYPISLELGRIETTHLLKQNGVFQYLTGLPSYPNPTTLRRFLLRMAPLALPKLRKFHEGLLLTMILKPRPPTKVIFDLDSTVLKTKVRSRGTSYIDPVKSENRKKSFFVKTASYKTALILRTHLA